MEILITAKTVSPTFTFDKLFIRAMNVIPFLNATLYVELHFIDPSGILTADKCSLSRTIVLSLDEYNLWVNDDYIINLVLTKLNLTKK
jgi:hypothetical protein